METCDFYAKPPRSNGLSPNSRGRTWGVWSLSTNAEVLQSGIPLHMHRDLFDMHFPLNTGDATKAKTPFCPLLFVSISTHVWKVSSWDPNTNLTVVFVKVCHLYPPTCFFLVLDWIMSLPESPLTVYWDLKVYWIYEILRMLPSLTTSEPWHHTLDLLHLSEGFELLIYKD